MTTPTATKPPRPNDIDMTSRRDALTLAIDAIENDPRSTPYGHHQWERARAVRRLRALRGDYASAETTAPRQSEATER